MDMLSQIYGYQELKERLLLLVGYKTHGEERNKTDRKERVWSANSAEQNELDGNDDCSARELITSDCTWEKQMGGVRYRVCSSRCSVDSDRFA